MCSQAFGRLQRGESVTTQAGVVVEPHQVMNPPSQPGPVLLVMDLPSEAHLAALEGVKGRQVLQQWLVGAGRLVGDGIERCWRKVDVGALGGGCGHVRLLGRQGCGVLQCWAHWQETGEGM